MKLRRTRRRNSADKWPSRDRLSVHSRPIEKTRAYAPLDGKQRGLRRRNQPFPANRLPRLNGRLFSKRPTAYIEHRDNHRLIELRGGLSVISCLLGRNGNILHRFEDRGSFAYRFQRKRKRTRVSVTVILDVDISVRNSKTRSTICFSNFTEVFAGD